MDLYRLKKMLGIQDATEPSEPIAGGSRQGYADGGVVANNTEINPNLMQFIQLLREETTQNPQIQLTPKQLSEEMQKQMQEDRFKSIPREVYFNHRGYPSAVDSELGGASFARPYMEETNPIDLDQNRLYEDTANIYGMKFPMLGRYNRGK